MRFEAPAVLALAALISHVSAFGVPKQTASVFNTALFAKTPEYDLSVPVFETKASEPVAKPAKKVKEPKKAPEPKIKEVELKQTTPEPKKEKKSKPKKVKEVEIKQPVSEPAAAKKGKPQKEKPQKVEKAKKEKPQKVDKPKKALPTPKPPKELSAAKQPFALPAGLALGAAPLIALPVLALLSTRTTLQNTKQRRDEIATNIAKIEAERAARALKKTDIDLGGVIKAGVSAYSILCHHIYSYV